MPKSKRLPADRAGTAKKKERSVSIANRPKARSGLVPKNIFKIKDLKSMENALRARERSWFEEHVRAAAGV